MASFLWSNFLSKVEVSFKSKNGLTCYILTSLVCVHSLPWLSPFLPTPSSFLSSNYIRICKGGFLLPRLLCWQAVCSIKGPMCAPHCLQLHFCLIRKYTVDDDPFLSLCLPILATDWWQVILQAFTFLNVCVFVRLCACGGLKLTQEPSSCSPYSRRHRLMIRLFLQASLPWEFAHLCLLSTRIKGVPSHLLGIWVDCGNENVSPHTERSKCCIHWLPPRLTLTVLKKLRSGLFMSMPGMGTRHCLLWAKVLVQENIYYRW